MSGGEVFFLSAPWVEVMRAGGAVSGVREVDLAGRRICLGEYRAVGQTKWLLFGAFDDPDGRGLGALFEQAGAGGVFRVASGFNMARWRDPALLRSLGAEITRDFGTYLLDLTPDEAVLWSGMDPKHRNMTRRAMQEGVEIRFGLEREAFGALLDETYARGGGGHRFSPAYLQALFALPADRLLLAGAWRGGALQAGIVLPFDRGCGYYLHGASRTGGVPGASNLLHWEAIRALKGMGVAAYDLGGAREWSDDPRLAGIFRFKKRFGGPFVACHDWTRSISPWRERLHDFFHPPGGKG